MKSQIAIFLGSVETISWHTIAQVGVRWPICTFLASVINSLAGGGQTPAGSPQQVQCVINSRKWKHVHFRDRIQPTVVHTKTERTVLLDQHNGLEGRITLLSNMSCTIWVTHPQKSKRCPMGMLPDRGWSPVLMVCVTLVVPSSKWSSANTSWFALTDYGWGCTGQLNFKLRHSTERSILQVSLIGIIYL